MRRMVYMIFAATTLIVLGAVAVGCTKSADDNTARLTSEPASDFVGISISQNHMDFTYCYSFYLREEDGDVLFDAQVRFYEEPYEIVLESCEVDSSYMKKLQKIEKKYSIVEYVENFKESKSSVQVMDETVNKTSVYYKDKDVKTADTSSEYEEELYNLFVEIAKKYQSNSVSVQG